jgi:large subunit ribosomal protein L43
MATRGIFQLQKLSLVYCEHGGSSRAVRDFIGSGRIIDWAKDHPHLQVELKVRNGKHPFVQGEYLTGPPKQVTVKNEGLSQIYKVMNMLKNQSGRKIKRFNRPVITQTPSIQGVWTPMLSLEEETFDIDIVAAASADVTSSSSSSA